MGYIAITPDMVSGLGPNGGNIDSFPASRLASEYMTGMNDVLVNSRLDAWADYGTKLPGANGKLAIVGLSWGGGATFRYVTSTHRKDLKAVCVFYDVGPPAVIQGPSRTKGLTNFPVDKISVPVYGFYPTKDTRVMASLQATKDAMAAAHKKYDVVTYQDAEHAYMRIGENPADTNPANAAAVKASLARLDKIFKNAFR
jgi:carboxymethylenebutenolidase